MKNPTLSIAVFGSYLLATGLGFGSPVLIAFALIDLSGAAWTWLALRATQ